ncbi:MAG: guanine deaminase [Bacteriovoracaceae bacterium]
MNSSRIVVLGNIVNPKSDKKCEFIRNGALVLKAKTVKGEAQYQVEEIGKEKAILKKLKDEKLKDGFQLIDYKDCTIMPAFFDMHFHWVQDDVREMPKANLLDWLDNYTFPTEKKFQNKKFSKAKSQHFFERLTGVGTLGGACYSSIHEHALDDAMNAVTGDFVIGNVLMTMNSPKFLTQTKTEAINLVKKLAAKYKTRYALTPRFAIATDPETMLETSKIAKKQKCFMQSHLCETKNEIDFVTNMYKEKKGFEKIKSYTEIYKKVGMLGKRSIMGHGIHLQKDELEMLSITDTAIAHCPTSNAPIKEKGLGSGLFNFKLIEKNKIRWALGSDIGGGPVLSMFDVIRSFVDQNKKAGVTGATYKKALYRSTLAGAELLSLDKKKGNLDIGKEANFIVLPKIKDSEADNLEALMERYVNKGRKKRLSYDNLVEKVFYKGHLVFSKS